MFFFLILLATVAMENTSHPSLCKLAYNIGSYGLVYLVTKKQSPLIFVFTIKQCSSKVSSNYTLRFLRKCHQNCSPEHIKLFSDLKPYSTLLHLISYTVLTVFQRKMMLLLIFVAEVYDYNLNPDAFLAHISKRYKKIINIKEIPLFWKE